MKTARKILFLTILAILLIIQIYPMLWLLVSSFRDNVELSSKPFSLPSKFTLENYQAVLLKSNTLLYMRNSAIIAAISLLSIVILGSMASFAISKLKFSLHRVIFSYFLIGLTIPYQVTLIPLFVMFKNFGILDSFTALIFPLVAFSLPVSVLLFVNFYRFIPNEIIEAGVMEGCGAFRIYTNIIMPLSINVIMTVVALNFIFVWNDYIFSVVFINSTNIKTVSLGLQDFIGSHGLTDWGATFASICISTIPTLAIYFFLNSRVVDGMTLGAVKS
jgi:raffinose/stachyose/melibiose transport system permease protein